jgi:hypothetical protein
MGTTGSEIIPVVGMHVEVDLTEETTVGIRRLTITMLVLFYGEGEAGAARTTVPLRTTTRATLQRNECYVSPTNGPVFD